MEERRNQEKIGVCISLIIKFPKSSVYRHIFEKSLCTGETETSIIRDISKRSALTKDQGIKFHTAYRKWKSRHNENGLVEIRMKRLGFISNGFTRRP